MRRKELILPPDPRIASLELALRIKEPYKNEQEKKTPSIKTAVMSTENRSPQLVPAIVNGGAGGGSGAKRKARAAPPTLSW